MPAFSFFSPTRPAFSFFCNRQLPGALGCVLTRHNSAAEAPQAVNGAACGLLLSLSSNSLPWRGNNSLSRLHWFAPSLTSLAEPPCPTPSEIFLNFCCQQIWKCSPATKKTERREVDGEYNFWKQHLPAKTDVQRGFGEGGRGSRIIPHGWVISIFFIKGNLGNRTGFSMGCFLSPVCAEDPLPHKLWRHKAQSWQTG